MKLITKIDCNLGSHRILFIPKCAGKAVRMSQYFQYIFFIFLVISSIYSVMGMNVWDGEEEGQKKDEWTVLHDSEQRRAEKDDVLRRPQIKWDEMGR